jgi:outer membrane protein TolC
VKRIYIAVLVPLASVAGIAWGIGAAVILAAPPAAGTAVPVEALNWDACVKETRENNPKLRTARYQLETSRLHRYSAAGGFLPRMDVLAGADGSGGKPYFRGFDPAFSSRLVVNQSLFSGFSTVAGISGAGASLKVAEARLKSAEADVRYGLRKAYGLVMSSQEKIRVRITIARRRTENLELTRKKVAEVKGEESSVKQAEAEVGRAEFEVSKARRALVRAQQSLSREMGRDKFQPVTVSVDWTVAPPPADPSMDGIVEGTPEVRQAVATVDETEAGLMEARAPFWPSIDAQAGVYRYGPAWPPAESRSWAVGAYVSYNLFSGTRDWMNFKVAVNSVNMAKEELVIARRSALEGLEEALSPYADAWEAIDVQRLSLEAARSRAEDSRRGYSEGKVDYDQWNEVEGGLVEAEIAYLDARLEAMTAEGEWLRASGTGL